MAPVKVAVRPFTSPAIISVHRLIDEIMTTMIVILSHNVYLGEQSTQWERLQFLQRVHVVVVVVASRSAAFRVCRR